MIHHSISTKKVIIISFVVDILDIFSNLTVSILTGSAVIFSEFVQGVADSVGSFLLLIGYYQSIKTRDEYHPQGHAREIFFWALLSSTVMLFFGSGISIWRGYQQLVSPEIIRHKWLALGVLLISFSTNGYSLLQSYKKLHISGVPFLKTVKHSTHQLVKTTLLRDGLGTLSAVIGFISIFLYDLSNNVTMDAIGALIIGILVTFFAVLLISQAKVLITGEGVPRETITKIRHIAHLIPEVVSVNRIDAIYSGTDQMIVDLDIDLKDNLHTNDIEKIFDSIQSEVVRQIPQVHRVRFDLNSPAIH